MGGVGVAVMRRERKKRQVLSRKADVPFIWQTGTLRR